MNKMKTVRNQFNEIDKLVRLYDQQDRLTNKKIVITNDAEGIGALLAILVAREGAEVLFMHNREPLMAFEVAFRIDEAGGRVIISEGDWSSVENVTRLVEVVQNFWGSVDAVFNTVPRGSYMLTKKVSPFLSENGHIINMVQSKLDRRHPKVARFLDAEVALTDLTYDLNENKLLRNKSISIVGIHHDSNDKSKLGDVSSLCLPILTKQIIPNELILETSRENR